MKTKRKCAKCGIEVLDGNYKMCKSCEEIENVESAVKHVESAMHTAERIFGVSREEILKRLRK